MVNSAARKLEKNLIEIVEVPKGDINWSTVSLSEVINKGKRLESSYYGVEYKRIIKIIQNSKYGYSNLQGGKNSIINSYRPGIIKRIFVESTDNSIPMLVPSQIQDIYPKAEKYLSKLMIDKIKDWFVKENEILLTCSGTIGNVTLVTETLKNKCVSQNLIRIICCDEFYGYVYTFLKSECGQVQLKNNNYGAVIKHIDPSHLDNVIIPNAPEKIKIIINNLIIDSYNNRDKSNYLIDKATNIMIDELGLPSIEELKKEAFSYSQEVNSFSTKLSELNGRLEGSYHLPLIDVIEKHIGKKAIIKTLNSKDITEKIILPGRFKRVYVEKGNGKVFLGGKEIGQLDPENKKYLSLSHHSNRIKKELNVEKNMVLVTCSGTIGKVSLVPEHWNNWTVNQHVMRILSKEPYYSLIFVWLNSEYGKELVLRQKYGSVVDEITDKQLGDVVIPIFKDNKINTSILNLIHEANELRYQAYKQEQEAINIMNKEVLGL